MDIMNITIATTQDLEYIAQALAEGEHELGEVATAAGAALVGWTGVDCPWFVPGPSAGGFEVADFTITEEV